MSKTAHQHWSSLAGLQPEQALELLVQAAEGGSAEELAEVWIQPGTQALSAITLFVPASGSPTHQLLEKAYVALRKMTPGTDDHLPGDVRDVRTAATELLLASRSGRAVVAPLENESLLVGVGLDPGTVARLCDTLRTLATSFQIAVADDLHDEGRRTYFLHVLDEVERGSGVSAGLSARDFRGCAILRCFATPDGLVFLPRGLQPNPDSLMNWSRLVRAAPHLFGSSASVRARPTTQPLGVPAQPLAAVYVWPPDGTTNERIVAYLGDVPFRRQVELYAPATGYARLRVVDLRANNIKFDELAQAIEEYSPGHRLELRPTAHTEISDRRMLDRLEEKMLDIQLQFAAAESMTMQTPRLYRFEYDQLPRLADVLCTYPPRVLRDDGLLYAFQAHGRAYPESADSSDVSGFHYLYVSPSVAGVLAEELRLPALPREHRPTRFWLDPYWSRHYYTGHDSCLVFVPRGTALFPPLHEWNPDDMSGFLRAAVGRWFGLRDQAVDLPTRAVFIFDGRPRPDAQIGITILDRDAFKPLGAQLGWLNTNLHVLRADKTATDLIRAASNAAQLSELRRELDEQTEQVRQDLDALAQSSTGELDAKLDGLLGALNAHIDVIVSEAKVLARDVIARRTALANLARVKREMLNLEANINRLIAELGGDRKSLTSRFLEEAKHVGDAIAKAEAHRQDIEQKAQAMIDQLNTSHDSLRQQLQRLT